MDKKQLINILSELSNAAKKVSSEKQLLDLINKYDMIFAGKLFNCINTIELRHTIDKTFGINLKLEELNALIPATCSELGMEIIPMVRADRLSDPEPYCYQIYL